MAIIFNGIFNIIHMFLVKKYIKSDDKFKEWVKERIIHNVVTWIVDILSVLCSFKSYRILFCRYFSFSFFKSELVDIDK